MKKLLMITAIILLGIGSLSAQTWDVTVNWDLTGTDCENFSSNQYEIVVAITIYDDANNVYVCQDVYHYTSINSNSYTFNATEAGVQAHCEDDLDDTPNLNVYATVRVINIAHTEQYCIGKGTNGDNPCSNFVNGLSVTATF